MDEYNKQKIELSKRFIKKELGHMDLIDLVIEARKQRDYNKKTLRKFKKANHNLAKKIQIAGKHLNKAKKHMVLN